MSEENPLTREDAQKMVEAINKSDPDGPQIELSSKPSEEQYEEIIEQQVEELSKDEEIERLSSTLHLYYNHFKKVGYELAGRKKRAPVRVLEALLFGEFHDIELSGKEEKILLDIAMKVVETKGKLYNTMVEKDLENEKTTKEETNE